MKQLVTKGNRKLKASGVSGSFDLPPEKTCPGAGACKRVCYGKKICRLYPAYDAKVERNFRVAKSLGFVRRITGEISQLSGRYFRIHGVGDFYSQRYFNRWVKVVKQFPDKVFYAYTKSLKLDMSRRPKNLVIIKSYGGKHDKLIRKGDLHAKIVTTPCRGYMIGNKDDLTFTKTKAIALIKH